MNKKPNTEEIDIIQFFSAIGNMFIGLFRGLVNIIKWFIFIIVDAILYVRKHYIVLSLGLLIGLIYSFFARDKAKPYYGEITLRTNYNAQMGLQEKVDMLNDFIVKHDFENLGKALNLTPKEARFFSDFHLKPASNDVFLLEDYEEYLMRKDTAVYEFFEFKKYKRNISSIDDLNRYWKLKITAYSPSVFKNLNESLMKLFNSDSLVIKRKQLYLSYLNLKKESFLKSLQDIDTMRKVFDKALLSGNKQGGQAVNLMLSNEDATVGGPEEAYNLFEERKNTLENLDKIIRQINKYSDAVVFLNSLPKTGITKESILNNKYVRYSLFGFLLALFGLLLIDFNRFLNKYEQQKKLKEE